MCDGQPETVSRLLRDYKMYVNENGLDVPSIDRVYRLDVGGTFAWSGDLFPSQDIYGTDYFGDPYQVDRFSEQVDTLGMPELMVDDWSSLQGQLQLR